MNFTKETYIGFLLGILVGGLIMYGALTTRTSTPSNSISSTTTAKNTGGATQKPSTSGNATIISGAYSVSAHDQSAGSEAEVTYKLPAAAWIAVHDDLAGKAGNVLGARLFEAGEGSGAISLLRKTLPDTTYRVMIYTDNGNRTFDYRVDKTVVGANNAPVLDAFVTSGGAASR